MDTTGERQKTILIIEDEQSLRQALVHKLQSVGYDVLEAGDGEEGLRIALEKHPDLLLVDVIMPKMDGLTMLKKLEEDGWGKQAKIIILSNLGDPEQEMEGLIKDKYDYFIKANMRLDDFLTAIKKKLEQTL